MTPIKLRHDDRVRTRTRSLLTFFLLTYAVTWTCFVAAAALSANLGSTGTPAGRLSGLLLLVGTVAPSLVAIGLTARDEGILGIQALLGRMFHWRVGAQWYVFAVSYMVAIKLAAALAYRLATGSWPRLGTEPWYFIVAAIAFSTPVQAGEEIGWRGYALPHLAARLGLVKASLLLGLIWACWHLPLFFIPELDKYGQSFPLWTLQVIALSVAAAWFYWHTNGSLLLLMLFHSAVNQSLGIVPSALPGAMSPFALGASLVGWLTLAFLWIPTVYFFVRMRRADFGRNVVSG